MAVTTPRKTQTLQPSIAEIIWGVIGSSHIPGTGLPACETCLIGLLGRPLGLVRRMQKHPGSLAPVVRPIRASPQSQAPRVRRRVQGERAAGEKALGACTREALAPSLGLPGDFAPSRGHKARPRPFPFPFPLAQICSSTGGLQVGVVDGSVGPVPHWI